MKAIIIEDKDCDALLDQLELAALRKNNHLTKEAPTVDDVHRTFHLVVVRWLQKQGYKGYRS